MSENEMIPKNEEGTQSNTESEASFASEAEAANFYTTVQNRLLNVNDWHELAGTATARFQLTDEKEQDVFREARKGDLFKIDLPAPGTITGNGHDWVRIEDIERSENFTAILVRPCSNPENDREDVAHFFSDSATSSFVVKRNGDKVIAAVYGRNEKPNTNTEKVIDTIRNTAVAVSAMSGFSKLQWKSLVNGLVKKEEYLQILYRHLSFSFFFE